MLKESRNNKEEEYSLVGEPRNAVASIYNYLVATIYKIDENALNRRRRRRRRGKAAVAPPAEWWECGMGAGSKATNSSLLNCGSENGGTDADGRKWKIFGSEATYNLPIKPQTRHFLRLYFYPSDYAGLNISNSYFSVMAAGVTLLNNFSAPITAQALTFAYLVKEYSLAAIDSDTLNITFKPSDKAVDGFAFVNGIEVILIPGDLLGSGSTTVGVNMVANKSVPIKYADLPENAAPVDVYKTARGMGPDSAMNLKLNLIWMFQVDFNPSTLHKPEFYHATLNGLEIFQISDQSNNLAGPNPELSAMLTKDLAEDKPKTFQSSGVGIEGAAGGAAGFCVVAAVCIAVYQKKRRVPNDNVESHTSSWLPLYTNSHSSASKSTISGMSTTSGHLSTLAQGKATKNFNESDVIGIGSFGKEYV
ncbi:hypothetical protein GH714_023458 [Hevea brasiliensis]|uniref:Uncharacterized protein n=1 Tax=Hevea brasiliensis TaxID=3981 RepID=A0A6A6LFI6_HEVBR|nr:hypothetical protein GH714_023458 [Hevea brasiliensis]